MASEKEIKEYIEASPNMRFWSVSEFSEGPILGQYLVVPFDDHMAEVGRLDEEFLKEIEKVYSLEQELQIVRAQRDLLAKKSGLPIPKVNGEEYL